MGITDLGGVDVCTSILRLTLRSSFRVTSSLCRWATCRGTLPLPVVTVCFAASMLSASPKKRIVTVGITLVALRTVAEALHSSVNSDECEDWDDDKNNKERQPKDDSFNDKFDDYDDRV